MAITDDTLDTAPAAELPPAGDEQRETLRRRLETLQAEIDALPSDSERIDPNALRRIHDETVRAMDPELAIRHPRPECDYSWVYRDPFNKFGGRFVHLYEAEGFEVVHTSDDDARGMKHGPDGTVWNADCLLMRVRKDVNAARRIKDREKRIAIQQGFASNIQELAARSGTRAYTDGLPDSVAEAMSSASARNMAARRSALGTYRGHKAQFDKAIRTGTIPGVPAPGARS